MKHLRSILESLMSGIPLRAAQSIGTQFQHRVSITFCTAKVVWKRVRKSAKNKDIRGGE